MRTLITCAAAAAIVVYTAVAQTCSPHPSDSSAEFLGFFSVTIPLPTQIAETDTRADLIGPLSNEPCTVMETVCVWTTGTGTDLVASPGGVSLIPLTSVDPLQIPELYGALSDMAVREAVELGYVSCADSSANAELVRVLQPGCVAVTQADSTTQLVPCTPDLHQSTFAVYCPAAPGGHETVVLSITADPAAMCANPCSPTLSE